MYDSDLCFREIIRRHTAGEPLITKQEKEDLNKKYFNKKDKDNKKSKEKEESKADSDKEKEEDKSNDSEESKEKSVEEEAKKDSKEEDKSDKEEEEETLANEKENESDQESNKDTKEKIKEEIKKEDDKVKTEPEEEKDCDSKTDIKTEDIKKELENVKTEVKTEDVKKENEDIKSEVKNENEEMEVDDNKVKDEDETSKDEVMDTDENSALSLETENSKDEKLSTDNSSKDDKSDNSKDDKSSSDAVSKTNESTKDKTEGNDSSSKERKIEVKSDAALMSLKQMDEAMARFGSNITLEGLNSAEPTVAQLLAQSAANPIKWPKDQILQIRIEHIMYAVEHNKWPVDMSFHSGDSDSRSGSNGDQSSDLILLEAEQRKRRQLEAAEVERAHIQALLHPNLHHTLGLKIPTSNAVSAAVTALGLTNNSFANATLRSFLESEDRDKRNQLADSNALRQLQALQGSLDLTIKPVSGANSSLDLSAVGLLPKRGPGRPRLDDPIRNPAEKRTGEIVSQEKKRRKLDEIVLGLGSKGKTPDILSSPKDTLASIANPLALLRGSNLSLHPTSKEKSQVTNSVTTPKLSSSISITPTANKESTSSANDADGTTTPSKTSSPDLKEQLTNSSGIKPGLVKPADLPPGINLPPGIELYRPTDSKVDKWLEQHQGLMADASKALKEAKKMGFDLSSIDWTKFSGDEHVPVINSATGKKVSILVISEFTQCQSHQWL